MRIFVNDLAILECARLGFIGIANEVNGLAAFAIDKGPLQTAGKTSAATASEARSFDLFADLFRGRKRFAIGQRFGRQSECFAEGFVTARAQITIEINGVTRLIYVL
jgi:hypothetical protein